MSTWFRFVRGRRRRGIVAPLVALCLVGLLGVVAIVVDGGLLLANRRKARAVADAAALAAAIDLYTNYATNNGLDPSGTAVASAKATAADNGVKNGAAGATVVINIPPKSGPSQGSPGFAEAIITIQQPRYFSSIFGSGNLSIAARAVARGTLAPKADGIIVLAPTGSNDLMTSNSANITVKNGSIIVNSSDPKGGTISNTGNISANALYFTGSPGYATSGSGDFIGTIYSSQAPTPDPLAALPPPSQPLDTYKNVNISNLPMQGGNVPGFPTPNDPNGWTLPPGTYDGGIHISDNNSAHTYTLQSGIYYFTNGGFTLSANAAVTSDSNGVLMYFHSGGALSITAGGPVTLSPMQSGTYAGLTIYQDRTNTSQDSITGQSTGSLNITGTVYTPAATFTLTGSGANYAIGSQYIVYQLVATGSGNFNVTYNGQASPNRDLYLVE
jgi:Flp pilus assembly protein TadG